MENETYDDLERSVTRIVQMMVAVVTATGIILMASFVAHRPEWGAAAAWFTAVCYPSLLIVLLNIRIELVRRELHADAGAPTGGS